MNSRTCWQFRQDNDLRNPLRVFYRDPTGVVTYSSKACESNNLLLSQCIIVFPIVLNKGNLFDDWFMVQHPLKQTDKVKTERLLKETRDPYLGGVAMINTVYPRHVGLPSLSRPVFFELEADAVMFSMWKQNVV